MVKIETTGIEADRLHILGHRGCAIIRGQYDQGIFEAYGFIEKLEK